MTITGQSSLAKDEIDRMVHDAEAHAADDRRRREEAETRNNADSLVYQTEKMLRDQAGSMSGPEKDTVESDLKTMGRRGSFKSARERRSALQMAVTASRWPTTTFSISVSMASNRWVF